jgi:hypothetical protein
VNRFALLDIGSLLIILRRIVEFGIAACSMSSVIQRFQGK